jgi:excisionase family DNA binding protein
MNKLLTPQLLTPADSANLCQEHGLRITPARIRQLEDQGKLPAIRTAGGYRLFRRQDIETYIKGRTAASEVA